MSAFVNSMVHIPGIPFSSFIPLISPLSLRFGRSIWVAIAILPVIVVYLLLSKFIVRGVALGGVKG